MADSKPTTATDLVLEFDSLGAGQAVRAILESAGVDALLDVVAVSAGVPSRSRLVVPADMAHRARWILSESDFSDAELTYLATGELNPKD